MERTLRIRRSRNGTYVMKSDDGNIAIIYSAKTKIEEIQSLIRQIQLTFAETRNVTA